MLVAAAAPPGRLRLRDDLRTRLGWGLVYELCLLPTPTNPRRSPAMRRSAGFGWPRT